jgi:carbamoylphosphate synthase large subunit
MQETFKEYSSALTFAEREGFPVLVESSFSLQWKGTASNVDEFKELFEKALRLSPVEEVRITPIASSLD